MQIKIEVTEKDVRFLVAEYMSAKLGDVPFDEKKVHILVKTKSNWKAEWEDGAFCATYEADV
jgi:hypothetical protein